MSKETTSPRPLRDLDERASSSYLRRKEKEHFHGDRYREPRYSSHERDDSYRRRREESSRDYTERDRERERERDRGRYNRRDKESDTSYRSRRSASPRTRETNTRPRSHSPLDGSPQNVAKPDFKPSGLLAAETNTVKAADGTHKVLKYNEPPEARKPILGWRLYVFKDSEQLGGYRTYLSLIPSSHDGRTIRPLAYPSPECLFGW